MRNATEFGGTLYQSVMQRNRAAARAWMTGSGTQSLADGFASGGTDKAIAAEILRAGWLSVNGRDEDDEPTPLCTLDEATEIIAELRAEAAEEVQS